MKISGALLFTLGTWRDGVPPCLVPEPTRDVFGFYPRAPGARRVRRLIRRHFQRAAATLRTRGFDLKRVHNRYVAVPGRE